MFVPHTRHHSCSSLGRLYSVRSSPTGSPLWASPANSSAIHLPTMPTRAPRPPRAVDAAQLAARLDADALRAPRRAVSGTSNMAPPRALAMRPPLAAHEAGTPDIRGLVHLANACRKLSPKHPDRQRLEARIEALLGAPKASCRGVVLDIVGALGIDQGLDCILRCAQDPDKQLRQRARDLLAGPGRAYSLAQAMLAEPEDFEVQYAGLRLLHNIVPVSESVQSPRARLLHEHLSAWQKDGALHYTQAADAIDRVRCRERLVPTP